MGLPCSDLLLAVVVRAQHTLGDEVLGGKAAAGRNLIGALQRLQTVDRGASHVDRVRRAERLAQDVVDAGFLEDDAGCATGDDARLGAAGFISTRPAELMPMIG